jgi:cytochrome c
MSASLVPRSAESAAIRQVHLLMLKTILLSVLAGTGPAHAAGDAARGAQLFNQCMACHSVRAGEHLTGPSLAHVWNRKAATAGDFLRYSDALKRSGVTWDEAALDAWLSGPEKFVPGNSMTFPGVRDAQARQDLIAYLKAVDERKAPPAAKNKGSGMMGMTRERPDLKKAPPSSQVRAITYCRDTYTVETADGKVEKIWESNLRFKSDSSKLGPLPGKPVVIGAGMQGDRASVVFASPKEISEAIVRRCP